MIHMFTLQAHARLPGRERLQTDRAFSWLSLRLARAHRNEAYLSLRRFASRFLLLRDPGLARGKQVLNDSSADSPEEENDNRLRDSGRAHGRARVVGGRAGQRENTHESLHYR